jgi:hypothetical protein
MFLGYLHKQSDQNMKSISALAIVSIIAILLAIGLIYIIVKPPSFLKTTTTSYIPTTEIVSTTITETTFIPTTFTFTTTYTLISTYQTPPTTITRTITETITYTYVPEEKIEITYVVFSNLISDAPIKPIYIEFDIINKEYSSLYIDPNRYVKIQGKGLLKDHPDYSDEFWTRWRMEGEIQRKPFILAGSPHNPPKADFCGVFYYPDYFNPKEIKKGQIYTISFDYKVVYLNGTISNWKTFSFNVTYTGVEQNP